MNIVKHYSNGQVTIVWKADICIHSGKCAGGLPSVFDPRERPWIRPEGATTQQIVAQIEKCPSGALTYFYNEEGEAPVP